MKNKIFAVALVAAGLLSSMPALAGPINTGTQVQSFSFALLDDSTTVSFNGFNNALGILNSVHFEWTMAKTLNNVVINLNNGSSLIGNPNAISATSTTTFTGSGIAVLLSDVNTLTTPGFTGTVPGGFVLTTVGTASATNLSGEVCLSNDASCGAGNTDLSAYIGGLNLFDIAIKNVGNQGGSVPPGVLTGNTGSANGTVSIFYDYTRRSQSNSVPEPASLGLMGLGLVGFSAFRRRKSI